MEREGFIYKITNNVNQKIYVGQTSRNIEKRFNEHITSALRGDYHSLLGKAIVKYGWQNFSIEEIEKVPISKLDEREKYWIQVLNSRNTDIGYNISIGGKGVLGNWEKVQIVENGIIFDSVEDLARTIRSITNWDENALKRNIRKCLNTQQAYLDYHYISLPKDSVQSDRDIQIDWIKTLSYKFVGKKIYCPELNKQFNTITEAAKYLYDNNLYITTSKTPIQSLVTAIGYVIHGKNSHIKGTNCFYTFEYIPGRGTKTQIQEQEKIFTKTPIYCPQLDMKFNSIIEAAHYMIDNNIWTKIKLKTAELRISDVVRGYFPDYKGYTFSKI